MSYLLTLNVLALLTAIIDRGNFNQDWKILGNEGFIFSSLHNSVWGLYQRLLEMLHVQSKFQVKQQEHFDMLL